MKKKVLYVGPMNWEQPVANLTKDDYSLPEELHDGICSDCRQRPMFNGKISLKCVICDADLSDDLVACGIGHICYNCWDDLKEGDDVK